MDHYKVKLRPKAAWQLDSRFEYAGQKARHAVASAILALDVMPRRGTVCYQRRYSDGEYRQLAVEGYIIVYRIYEEEKTVEVFMVKNEKALR